MKDDTISRQAALDALTCKFRITGKENAETVATVIDEFNNKIKALPSAQPEPEEFEWCHTCREYDQENHCCHRWTKVIRQTVEDMKAAQPGWISVTERLPKKDGDYLVTTHSGQIARYIFIGGSSEEYWRRCATAWMPLPKPWEGENNG